MKYQRLLQLVTCASLLGLLTACGTSPPVRLYLLEPVAMRGSDQGTASLTVLVNSVTLPEYLTRKEILSREQHYVISAAAFDRWAEPLDNNIAATLAENLSVLIASDRVFAYPWNIGGSVDFAISVQILTFGPDPTGEVVLHALWRIDNSAGDTLVLNKSRHIESQSGNDIAATVAAMSRTIAALSRDIATTLHTLPDSSGD